MECSVLGPQFLLFSSGHVQELQNIVNPSGNLYVSFSTEPKKLNPFSSSHKTHSHWNICVKAQDQTCLCLCYV